MKFLNIPALVCAAAFMPTVFIQGAFAQTASDTVSVVNFENREVGVYGNAEAKEDFKRNDYDKSGQEQWRKFQGGV